MIDLKQILNNYRTNAKDITEFQQASRPVLQLVSRLTVINDLLKDCQKDISVIPDEHGILELKDKLNALDWINEYDHKLVEELLNNV